MRTVEEKMDFAREAAEFDEHRNTVLISVKKDRNERLIQKHLCPVLRRIIYTELSIL